jgi:hypothetical protein
VEISIYLIGIMVNISGTTYGMVWNNGVSDYECLYNVFGMMELGEMETGMDHIST